MLQEITGSTNVSQMHDVGFARDVAAVAFDDLDVGETVEYHVLPQVFRRDRVLLDCDDLRRGPVACELQREIADAGEAVKDCLRAGMCVVRGDRCRPARASTPADVGPTAEQWEALRFCESSGNYGAISPTGNYRGAYQFSRVTWDWIAGIYHQRLVGLDPAEVAPADQDAMAQSLYDLRGRGQWPVCGRYLP